MLRRNEEDFKRNTSIYTTPLIMPFEVGFIKFTMSCLLTLQMLHTKEKEDVKGRLIHGARRNHKSQDL